MKQQSFQTYRLDQVGDKPASFGLLLVCDVVVARECHVNAGMRTQKLGQLLFKLDPALVGKPEIQKRNLGRPLLGDFQGFGGAEGAYNASRPGEVVAWGETLATLSGDNLARARHMVEAFDSHAHICDRAA